MFQYSFLFHSTINYYHNDIIQTIIIFQKKEKLQIN